MPIIVSGAYQGREVMARLDVISAGRCITLIIPLLRCIGGYDMVKDALSLFWAPPKGAWLRGRSGIGRRKSRFSDLVLQK
ncbi:MAG: hypothetical protein CUN53_15125 [Phototrophicales bacterium]|nr:MAG: hypothetical protein CUN53_15125 [Phototrophicales bacterium]